MRGHPSGRSASGVQAGCGRLQIQRPSLNCVTLIARIVARPIGRISPPRAIGRPREPAGTGERPGLVAVRCVGQYSGHRREAVMTRAIRTFGLASFLVLAAGLPGGDGFAKQPPGKPAWAARPAQVRAEEWKGNPNVDFAPAQGYFVWQDDNGWHVRWTTKGRSEER